MIPSKFYAGVGSRDTPKPVLDLMKEIAIELAEHGYILRSGHSDGADLAFERGSNGKNQIWLPWKDFNYESPQAQGLKHTGHFVYQYNWMADSIAKALHPGWNNCSDGAKKLHTRNIYQVLGPGLGVVQQETVSRFVVCWTADGKASGGTGQAIRCAEAYKIPIFNLHDPKAFDRLAKLLGEIG